MLSKHPQLSAENVIETLRAEAEELGEEGCDQYYGWGLVDAYSAVSQTPILEFPNVLSLILVILATAIVFLLLKKVHGTCRRS